MPINSRNKGKIGEGKGEIWRPMCGYEGFYEVSNYGRVKTLKRTTTHERIMRTHVNRRNGYVYVVLSKNGKRGAKRVHIAVMEAFTDFRSHGFDPNHVIDHIDGDKTNNRLENLEVVTQKENDRRAREAGRQKKFGRSQKVINLDTKEIFGSFTKASESVGGKTGEMVARVCRGEKSHYRGYRFARYDDYINGTIPKFNGAFSKRACEKLWR